MKNALKLVLVPALLVSLAPQAHARMGSLFEPGDLLSLSCTPDSSKDVFTFPAIAILTDYQGDPSAQVFTATLGSHTLVAQEKGHTKADFGNANAPEVGPWYGASPITMQVQIKITNFQATMQSIGEITGDSKVQTGSAFSLVPSGAGNNYTGSLTVGGKTFEATCHVGLYDPDCKGVDSDLIMIGGDFGGQKVLEAGTNYTLGCGSETIGGVTYPSKTSVTLHLRSNDDKPYSLDLPSSVIESPRREQLEAAVRAGAVERLNPSSVRVLASRYEALVNSGVTGNALNQGEWAIADDWIAAVLAAQPQQ